jgi:hypothetical protein
MTTTNGWFAAVICGNLFDQFLFALTSIAELFSANYLFIYSLYMVIDLDHYNNCLLGKVGLKRLLKGKNKPNKDCMKTTDNVL